MNKYIFGVGRLIVEEERNKAPIHSHVDNLAWRVEHMIRYLYKIKHISIPKPDRLAYEATLKREIAQVLLLISVVCTYYGFDEKEILATLNTDNGIIERAKGLSAHRFRQEYQQIPTQEKDKE